MSYDRDRAMREQEVTEAMIRMRDAPAARGEWKSKMRPINKPYGPSDFPIGTRVTHKRDSGGDLTTETISTVFYRKGGWSSEGHFVFVEGVASPVPLDHLSPLPK